MPCYIFEFSQPELAFLIYVLMMDLFVFAAEGDGHGLLCRRCPSFSKVLCVDVYDVFRHVSLLGAVVKRTCICFLLLAFVEWTTGW